MHEVTSKTAKKKIKKKNSQDKWTVTMNIDDVPLTLKIDTGPYVTVRSEETFNTLPKVYNV